MIVGREWIPNSQQDSLRCQIATQLAGGEIFGKLSSAGNRLLWHPTQAEVEERLRSAYLAFPFIVAKVLHHAIPPAICLNDSTKHGIVSFPASGTPR
jgi:hypothetical protein